MSYYYIAVKLFCNFFKTLLLNQYLIDFFSKYIDLSNQDIHSTSFKNFDLLKNNKLKTFIHINNINNVRYINKYFELVNRGLETNGYFISCFESIENRNDRLRKNTSKLYIFFSFLFHRVFSKLPILKFFYFQISKGKHRVLSKAEVLGRLVCCGFKIIDYVNIDGLNYFIVKKNTLPTYDLNPSYGPIYKMPRLGKNGNIIGVYKLRTMHPYSEYLQDYILKLNGYDPKTGKPAKDFRLTSWSKVIRKYWLDELPQLINLIKGEMNLVGTRPVSARYFQDIPVDIQRIRLKYKPGCIPPYVSLNMPGSVEGVIEAEKIYLLMKHESPYTTDFIFFFKAIFNIIFRFKRSA
jgi:hypothetical protein